MGNEEKCSYCSGPLDRDSIGLTLTIYGLDYNERYCMGCLQKKMQCSEEWLKNLLNYFKERGCPLFG